MGQAVKENVEFIGSYGEYLFTWERLTSQGGFPFWIKTNAEVARVMRAIEQQLQDYPYFDRNTKRLGVLNLFDCVFKKWVQYKLTTEVYQKFEIGFCDVIFLFSAVFFIGRAVREKTSETHA